LEAYRQLTSFGCSFGIKPKTCPYWSSFAEEQHGSCAHNFVTQRYLPIGWSRQSIQLDKLDFVFLFFGNLVEKRGSASCIKGNDHARSH